MNQTKKIGSEYDFFKNCKKITPPGQSSFAQELSICTAENYYVPKDIKMERNIGLIEVPKR